MLDPQASYDFGDRSCGDGVTIEFKQRLAEVAPGTVLEFVVRDAGAKADLPAMCRLLGHDIVETEERDGALAIRVRRA